MLKFSISMNSFKLKFRPKFQLPEILMSSVLDCWNYRGVCTLSLESMNWRLFTNLSGCQCIPVGVWMGGWGCKIYPPPLRFFFNNSKLARAFVYSFPSNFTKSMYLGGSVGYGWNFLLASACLSFVSQSSVFELL